MAQLSAVDVVEIFLKWIGSSLQPRETLPDIHVIGGIVVYPNKGLFITGMGNETHTYLLDRSFPNTLDPTPFLNAIAEKAGNWQVNRPDDIIDTKQFLLLGGMMLVTNRYSDAVFPVLNNWQ